MATHDGICVLIQRRVRAGCEAAFDARLRQLVADSERFPGVRGVFVVQPPPGGRDWGILRRFDGPAERDAFYASELFRTWDASVAPLTEGAPQISTVSGIEAWFGAPGRMVRPPPRWRMALVTLLGVYPLSLLLPPLVAATTAGWPHLLAILLQAAAFVALLTWLVMPLLTRLLRRWLSTGR